MPITIEIKYADDDGAWHDFATVPDAHFETAQRGDRLEHRIHYARAELPDLVELAGTRLWQFNWLKGGRDGGLQVRRMMSFEWVADHTLALKTADAVQRAV